MSYDLKKLKAIVDAREGKTWTEMADHANKQGLVTVTGKPWAQGSLWSEAARQGWIKSQERRKYKGRKKGPRSIHANGEGQDVSYHDLEEIMTSNLPPRLKLQTIKLMVGK